MDRRSSLALLLGQQKKSTSTSTAAASFLGTLNSYGGTWGFEQAAHLLRRTTFGPTYAQIKQAANDGMEATISQLFMPQPMPDPPIYYNFENDPNAALGETWVNAPYSPDIQGLNGGRRRSLFAWTFKLINEEEVSIREKMVLFWHNHFVVADTNDPRRQYFYINFLRENALGNFKTLAEGITIDPSMLQYLNGTQSTAVAPNENYARELLELFTIGKGDSAGPGDYTNYTEDDVVQIARALTGWRHFDATDLQAIKPSFVLNRHDQEVKQLSHRFNNTIITNQGEEEYKTVIDIIFQQDEVARFISRKLYRWFVHFDINSDVEVNIIEPMAQLLIDNNYDIQPALMALLSSDHFYEENQIGCMITHPLDYFFKMINTFEVQFPADEYEKLNVMNRLFGSIESLEMVMYYHPSVAGWKAFYQEPQYYKFWINAVTLPIRMNRSDLLTSGVNFGGFNVNLNLLDFVASLDNPSDPNDLIRETASILFVYPLSQDQVDALKSILIPGLPDFEWTVEYSEYASGNTSLAEAVENKLKTLIGSMLKMPEFYLI